MSKLSNAKLDFVREDDYVEYFVFPQLPENLTYPQLDEHSLDKLHKTLSAWIGFCKRITDRLIKDRQHIWHKDEFQLQMRTGTPQERLLSDETAVDDKTVRLPPHLYGVTHYGDNIEDEWFIVHILYTLTKEIPELIVRVCDSDGEFLLIEAADFLPKWANPESCEQRVYIKEGYLNLVQNSPSNTGKLINVHAAILKMRHNPSLYRVSKEVQNCITERMKVFFEPTNSSLHRQIVRLPLNIAAILKQRPALIAPAVRAFCERDAIDLKACRSMRYFPPEQRVRMSVCFTRCLYAMLMHSNYVPDRKIGWNLGSDTNTEQYKEDILGIKIACGFEILASQAKDMTDDEQDPAWRSYLQSLNTKGYFSGNLEGSEEYKRLLAEAKTFFKLNNEQFRTAPLVGSEILRLLGDVVFYEQDHNLQSSDSDNWLNITAEELDAMLAERYGEKKLYKTNGDVNAEEFTKNVSEFLEKQSPFDGIDTDTDEDNKASTSNVSGKTNNISSGSKLKKNKSMRKACDKKSMPDAGEKDNTHVRDFLDFVIPEDNWDSASEMSDYGDEDDLERNIRAMTNSERNIDMDIKEYMKQMDLELARTTVGMSFERTSNKSDSTQKATETSAAFEDDFDDIESFEPININVNTLKNMMDSYKSQLGGAGPVSNLMNAMGVGMSASAGTAKSDQKAENLTESSV